MRGRVLVAAAALAGALAIPASSVGAQEYLRTAPASDERARGETRTPEVLGVTRARPATAPAAATAGVAGATTGRFGVSDARTLPVTGGDLAGLAVLGGAAIATGAGLTRFRRRPSA